MSQTPREVAIIPNSTSRPTLGISKKYWK